MCFIMESFLYFNFNIIKYVINYFKTEEPCNFYKVQLNALNKGYSEKLTPLTSLLTERKQVSIEKWAHCAGQET